MTINENIQAFVGRRVEDWSPGQPLPDLTQVAPRLRLDWDDLDDGVGTAELLIPRLEQLASAAGDKVEALVIGSWGQSYDNPSTPIVAWLAENAARLPGLRALFLGDMTFEESEISWIEQSDVTPVLRAYPAMEVLAVRGSNHLVLEPVEHPTLRGLVIECGGMPGSVVRAVTASTFPSLFLLELWLGDDNYGYDATLDDLQPILDQRFAVSVLGLRNAENQDEIAAAVADAPVLDGLRALDLSLGNLTDLGGEALLASAKVPRLQRLDLHHHYLSREMMDRLLALPIQVDVSDPQQAKRYDDEVYRPIAVAE